MDGPGEEQITVLSSASSSPSLVLSGEQNAIKSTPQLPTSPAASKKCKPASTQSRSESASEIPLVQNHAHGVKDEALPTPPSSSSSKRASPAGVGRLKCREMGSRPQQSQMQGAPMPSSSSVPPTTVFVKRTVSNKSNEDRDENVGGSSVSKKQARKASCGDTTGTLAATVTGGATPITTGVPYSHSSASLPLSQRSHMSITTASCTHNTTTVSPSGGGGGKRSAAATNRANNTPVVPPRLFCAAGKPQPSSTVPATAFEEPVTSKVQVRLPTTTTTTTTTSTGHAVTLLSSPTVAESTPSVRPESTVLSNTQTYFPIGGSRQRKCISVPTGPYQVDSNETEDTYMWDGVCSAGERSIGNSHHRAAPDHGSDSRARLQPHNTNMREVASENEFVDTPPTQPSLNAGYSVEDEGTSSHTHSTASMCTPLSAPPASLSHTVSMPAASPSLGPGTTAFLASAAPACPGCVSTSLPTPAALQGFCGGRRSSNSSSTRNASNVSLSTEHVRNSTCMGLLTSPLVSPTGVSVASGKAGTFNLPVNRGSAAHSRCDSHSPSVSLRTATHDPYNTSAIVATPIPSGVPRTKSLTSHHLTSPTTTPTGQGMMPPRMQFASAPVNGSACGVGGNAVESGISHSDTVSMKSSMADLTRGTHDSMSICVQGGGSSGKPLPSTSMWNYFLCGPQGPNGGYAALPTARCAHEAAPAASPTSYSLGGESGADAPCEIADPQYHSDRVPFEQRSHHLQYDWPYQRNEEQGQQMPYVNSYAPPYESQPPAHHSRRGPGQKSSPHYRRANMAHGRPMPIVAQQRRQQGRYLYPLASDQNAMYYGNQAYAEPLLNCPSPMQKEYQSQNIPLPHTPQAHPQKHTHAAAAAPLARQPPYSAQPRHSVKQPHYPQKPLAGRSGNSAAMPNNWSGPRKRTPQNALLGLFSEGTIQLGDRTHLFADRNGVPYEDEQQQQQRQQELGYKARHEGVPFGSDNSLDHIPQECQASQQGSGFTAALEFENGEYSMVMPSTLVVGQRQRQPGCPQSVHFDPAPAPHTLGEYFSDDNGPIRMNCDAPHTPQSQHADQHRDNAPIVTVGDMVTPQPQHVASQDVSRTPNRRAGHVTHYPGGSSGSGPSKKPMLTHSNVSGAITSREANESGSGDSSGGAGMTQMYNVGGGTGAPASTSLGGASSAAAAVTTYSTYQRYPSTNNYVIRSGDVYPSHLERRTTTSVAATSSSQDGANESRSTSNALFVPPLPRSAGATDGDTAMEHRPPQGQAVSTCAPLKGQQHQQRHPSECSSATGESQTTNDREDYSPHIAAPIKHRPIIPSVNQPNQFDGMHDSQHQPEEQYRPPSERGNTGSDYHGHVNSTSEACRISGIYAQGASVSRTPLLNEDVKTNTAFSGSPYDGCPMAPSRERRKKANAGRRGARSMQTPGISAPLTQQQQRWRMQTH